LGHAFSAAMWRAIGEARTLPLATSLELGSSGLAACRGASSRGSETSS
jgi:hypothetical protein